MILIIGSAHDDILYFDAIMSNKKKEMILNKFDASIGTIFNQDVLLVYNSFTSLLSSSIVSHILTKYYIDLVIVVGKCLSLSKDLKLGDIVTATRVINANIDLLEKRNVVVGQIPNCPRDFKCSLDVNTYIIEGLNRRTYTTAKNATFLSSDTKMSILNDNKNLFNLNDSHVIDFNSGGIALACYLHQVPFTSVKVVEQVYGEENNIDSYLKVLDKYVALGKGIVSAIGDIGRNDVLIIGGGNNL